ncbi:MAG: V-type ATPase subunit [Sulfolobales archaeon]
MVWDVYAAVRARIVYAGRLGKNVVEDMLAAGNAGDAIGYLRETPYYQYIRNVSVENQELLELSLYLGLYRSIAPLLAIVDRAYRSIAEHGLLFIENRVIASMLISLALGELPSLDLKILEGTRLGELYRIAIEDRSFIKALDHLRGKGFASLVENYNILSKYMDPGSAISIASDIGAAKDLSNIVKSEPSLSRLICPEIDFILVQTAIRISRGKAKEYIGPAELSNIACRIDRGEIEDLYSYREEENIMNVLRKIYGTQLVQRSLEESLINITSHVRKTVRSSLEAAFSSYPFDPSVVWAAIRVRVMDVEDIIAIINGKKAGLPIEIIRKIISITV